MREYIDHIILPYIKDKRNEFKLASDYSALLISKLSVLLLFSNSLINTISMLC